MTRRRRRAAIVVAARRRSRSSRRAAPLGGGRHARAVRPRDGPATPRRRPARASPSSSTPPRAPPPLPWNAHLLSGTRARPRPPPRGRARPPTPTAAPRSPTATPRATSSGWTARARGASTRSTSRRSPASRRSRASRSAAVSPHGLDEVFCVTALGPPRRAHLGPLPARAVAASAGPSTATPCGRAPTSPSSAGRRSSGTPSVVVATARRRRLHAHRVRRPRRVRERRHGRAPLERLRPDRHRRGTRGSPRTPPPSTTRRPGEVRVAATELAPAPRRRRRVHADRRRRAGLDGRRT